MPKSVEILENALDRYYDVEDTFNKDDFISACREAVEEMKNEGIKDDPLEGLLEDYDISSENEYDPLTFGAVIEWVEEKIGY